MLLPLMKQRAFDSICRLTLVAGRFLKKNPFEFDSKSTLLLFISLTFVVPLSVRHPIPSAAVLILY